MHNKQIHDRILDCRYYNDEDEPPIGINELFWDYERYWVHAKDKDWKGERWELIDAGLNNFESGDGTPFELKCLLYNRYCHWNYNFSPNTFLNWYISQYQSPRLTNRQRRYLHRKEKLIGLCRYYKGETDCPFSDPKDEHFWKHERIWVDQLATSYHNADKMRLELNPYTNIQALAKEYNLPGSFIGFLINRDIHWMGIFNESDFINSIKQDYLKLKK